MSQNHKYRSQVAIGEIMLDNDTVKEMSGRHGPEGGAASRSRATVLVSASSAVLPQIDYRQKCQVQRVDEATNTTHPQLTGWIVSARAQQDGRNVELHARDSAQLLEEARAGGCGWEVTDQEMVQFLLDQIPGIDSDIEGIDPNPPIKLFVVIMTISGIHIATKPLDLLGVRLYSPLHGDREEQLIATADSEQIRSAWAESVPRGRVYVRARTLYEAMQTGREKIQRALDWLNFRCSLAAPGYFQDGQLHPVEYRRECAWPAARLPGWAYARDSEEHRKKRAVLWYIDSPIGETEMEISADDSYWSEVLDLVAGFLDLPHAWMTPDQRSLADCIRWLSRAHDDKDPFDAFADLWTALELLLATQEISPSFQKAEKRRLKQCLRGARETNDDSQLSLQWLSNRQWERLMNVLDLINSSPLHAKFMAFCDSYEPPIAEPDVAFLWKQLRPKRNQITHGAFAEVHPNDIQRMRGIIQKMVLAKSSAIALSSSHPPILRSETVKHRGQGVSRCDGAQHTTDNERR